MSLFIFISLFILLASTFLIFKVGLSPFSPLWFRREPCAAGIVNNQRGDFGIQSSEMEREGKYGCAIVFVWECTQSSSNGGLAMNRGGFEEEVQTE